MRVAQSIIIPFDEIVVANIDLVARARRQIISNLGDNLISASPALIIEKDDINSNVTVELAMHVYESHDFGLRIAYLRDNMDADSYMIMLHVLSEHKFTPPTKELLDGK